MLWDIHENNLRANHSVTALEQKVLLEAFCNECLQQNNVWAVAGEGPLVYKESNRVFEEVWHTNLDGMEKRKDSNDVYSAFDMARRCDTALKEAQANNRTLSARIR